MRELQVWGDEEGLKQVFADIENLGTQCRFRNCNHQHKSGCAVQAAIENGSLDPKRLENFLKLQKEFAYLENRKNMKANALEKARWKNISKLIKNIKKDQMQ
jgi:ribosome biogenesis GTPase